MAHVPPDRSHVMTEQRNARSMGLHQMAAGEIVSLINEEDRGTVEAVEGARGAITKLIEDVEPRFMRGGRVVYVGAGTSGRLGVLDASECPPTFQTDPGRVVGIIAGGDSALRKSSEGKEDEELGCVPELERLGLTGDDVVIGIAAGGTTLCVLGALRWVKGQTRSVTAMISCSMIGAEVRAYTDHVIELRTGPEVLTGSTRMKAGTATKMTLNIITTTLMIRSGRVYENLMVDVRATNAKLRDRAARIVSTLTGLTREGSMEVLDRANGSVKAAIVMERKKVGLEEAERLIAAGNGRLGDVLG